MKPTRYFAYLLRIWQAGSSDQPEWRASLEEARTHTITGFASLAALCQFLLQVSEPAEQIDNPPSISDPKENP